MRECCGTNSNVERTARQPFTGSRGAWGKARCQHFHLLLIVLRLTSADKGSWAVCPGCRSMPVMTWSQGERRHKCRPFRLCHFFSGVISHPRRLLGRQCIMEGTRFTFDSDELLTRAKNQSATHTTGRGFVQASAARPEGCLPQPSAVVFRCIYPPERRRNTENNPTPRAASKAWCWQQHARFSLGSPHTSGTLPHTLQRQARFLPGQERTSWARENQYEDVLQPPWAWCDGPQLETCRAWAAESAPICQNLSWCRGERICPIHLQAEAK